MSHWHLNGIRSALITTKSAHSAPINGAVQPPDRRLTGWDFHSCGACPCCTRRLLPAGFSTRMSCSRRCAWPHWVQAFIRFVPTGGGATIDWSPGNANRWTSGPTEHHASPSVPAVDRSSTGAQAATGHSGFGPATSEMDLISPDGLLMSSLTDCPTSRCM